MGNAPQVDGRGEVKTENFYAQGFSNRYSMISREGEIGLTDWSIPVCPYCCKVLCVCVVVTIK